MGKGFTKQSSNYSPHYKDILNDINYAAISVIFENPITSHHLSLNTFQCLFIIRIFLNLLLQRCLHNLTLPTSLRFNHTHLLLHHQCCCVYQMPAVPGTVHLFIPSVRSAATPGLCTCPSTASHILHQIFPPGCYSQFLILLNLSLYCVCFYFTSLKYMRPIENKDLGFIWSITESSVPKRGTSTSRLSLLL